ncbi:MAG: NADH-quinone oxidoreductase subunit C [Nitrososphaerota archaeon]|nr:NADH-quinone oxidoreductase subunit C [Nitrososphaerota archaeon]MDG6974215.1 NADH-quinone oxidoreductase subunit C [Nitrososphaerota archaeon]MDG7019248.1 NADH-quinone oxidoreductase subunit C [Nitrososphaerota archaeon]
MSKAQPPQPSPPQPLTAAPTTPPRAQAPPAAPAPTNPEPVRAKEFAAKFTAKFPSAKVDWTKEHRVKLTVTPQEVGEAALFVRDSLKFDHISTVSGVDWIARNELEVVYFVGSSVTGLEDFVFALAERVPRDDPVVPTLIAVWRGAEYPERETHEMFGINFKGHPSQAHLFLPEDWNDLPPLRKDYVSPGR